MEIFEVDLIDRKTGDSVMCIYSGDDHDVAYEIANEFNKANLGDYDEEKGFSDYIDKISSGLSADIYHCEREEQVYGVGTFKRKKKYEVIYEYTVEVYAKDEYEATEKADELMNDGKFVLHPYIRVQDEY